VDFLVAITANWRDYQEAPELGMQDTTSKNSWLMQEAGGIRRSVMYHLNGLKKGGFIKVV
jgi:hypothetical protein